MEAQQELPIEPSEGQEEPKPDPSAEKLTQLESSLQEERESRIRLEGQISALQTQAQTPAPVEPEERVYSRIELQSMLDDGKISESQRDQMLDDQRTKQLRKEILAEVRQENQAFQAQQSIQSQVSEYTSALPDLYTQGSDHEKRAAKELTYLIQMGQDPNQLSTKLLAMKLAFGEASKLKEVSRKTRETHAETSSGSGDAGEPAKDLGPSNINNRMRSFYKEQIEKGRYTGWDDPNLKKELKYVR